jgi:hypothetical protein
MFVTVLVTKRVEAQLQLDFATFVLAAQKAIWDIYITGITASTPICRRMRCASWARMRRKIATAVA